jgi:hypothetical protein
MMYYVNPYSDNYGDKNIIEDPEPEIAWAERLKSFPMPVVITLPAPEGLRDPREAAGMMNPDDPREANKTTRPTPIQAI